MEDLVGDGDLPDVVEHRGAPQLVDGGLAEAERFVDSTAAMDLNAAPETTAAL